MAKCVPTQKVTFTIPVLDWRCVSPISLYPYTLPYTYWSRHAVPLHVSCPVFTGGHPSETGLTLRSSGDPPLHVWAWPMCLMFMGGHGDPPLRIKAHRNAPLHIRTWKTCSTHITRYAFLFLLLTLDGLQPVSTYPYITIFPLYTWARHAAPLLCTFLSGQTFTFSDKPFQTQQKNNG